MKEIKKTKKNLNTITAWLIFFACAFAPVHCTQEYLTNIHQLFENTVADDENAVMQAIRSLEIGYSGEENDTGVTGDITLPTAGADGVSISWASDNEAVIDVRTPGTGVVTQPEPGENDIRVTLTATLTSNAVVRTKTFILTVIISVLGEDAIAVTNAKTNLMIIYNSGDSASSVTKDITLPAELDGVMIAWVSNNDAIDVTSTPGTGMVTRPDTADTMVRLTATLTKNTAMYTKTFDLNVKVSDAGAVEAAKNNLAITHSSGDSVASVIGDITLPVKLANGVTITWASNNDAIDVTSTPGTGTVTRPSDMDLAVTLTATLTKGTANDTKEFMLNILANFDDLTRFVDVFIGTQYSHSESYQASRVYPVASVPFGMVVFTPVTGFHGGVSWGSPDDNAGGRTSGRQLPTYLAKYSSHREKIKGFSAYSFQGVPCNISHDFLMMPSTVDADGENEWLSNQAAGNPPDDFKVHTSRVHRTGEAERKTAAGNLNEEWAEPGYYRVKTKRDTVIEISATKRTGIMKITYPSTATAGYFHLASYTRVDGFDDANSWVRAKSGNDKALEGQVRAGKVCGEGGDFRYIMFMYGEFDRSYAEDTVRSDGNEIRVKFDLSTVTKVVVYKFGLSYVDLANAQMNLLGREARPGREATLTEPAVPPVTGGVGENVALSFDQVKANARNAWDVALNKIKVRNNHDGTGVDYTTRTSDKRRLYTFLFRSLLHPNIFSDVDGRYVGFNGSSTVGENQNAYHTLPAAQENQYQYFSNWDIYRTQIPLLALIDKQVSRDIARSLLNNANQAGNADNSGGFTRWGVANHDSGLMGGNPASSVMISSQYALGADLSKAEQDQIIQVFERSGKLADLKLKGSETSGCNHEASTCYLAESGFNAGATTSNTRSGGAATIKSAEIRNNPFSNILELAVADYTKAAFIRRSIQQHGETDRAVTDLETKAAVYKDSSTGWTQLFRDGASDSLFKTRTIKRYTMHNSNSCSWFGIHRCYLEGNKVQYEWAMPHDMAGRFAEGNESNTVHATTKIVSNSSVLRKLNRHFALNDLISGEVGTTYNAGSQVGFGTPYVYYYIGRPNETMKIVRQKLLDRYWDDNFIAYPGNEDAGSMSSRFVVEYTGLYNHSFGTGRLLLMYPAFDYIEFNLDDNGKKVILTRDPTSTAPSSSLNACVEKTTITGFDHDMDPTTPPQSGVEHTKSYINYKNFSERTVISFKIVPRPVDVVSGRTLDCRTVTTWGRKEGDIPPSDTDL